MMTIQLAHMSVVLAACAITLVGSLNLLVMTLHRETVKRDLRARCFSPVSIRWQPLAREVLGWRTRSHAFQVIFADFLGNIRTTRCYFRQRLTGFPWSELIWTEPEKLLPAHVAPTNEN